MPKKKKKSDHEREAKLVVRIESDLRDAFLEACHQRDTTASREVRRFIREFLSQADVQEAHRQPHQADS